MGCDWGMCRNLNFWFVFWMNWAQMDNIGGLLGIRRVDKIVECGDKGVGGVWVQ